MVFLANVSSSNWTEVILSSCLWHGIYSHHTPLYQLMFLVLYGETLNIPAAVFEVNVFLNLLSYSSGSGRYWSKTKVFKRKVHFISPVLWWWEQSQGYRSSSVTAEIFGMYAWFVALKVSFYCLRNSRHMLVSDMLRCQHNRKWYTWVHL